MVVVLVFISKFTTSRLGRNEVFRFKGIAYFWCNCELYAVWIFKVCLYFSCRFYFFFFQIGREIYFGISMVYIEQRIFVTFIFEFDLTLLFFSTKFLISRGVRCGTQTSKFGVI